MTDRQRRTVRLLLVVAAIGLAVTAVAAATPAGRALVVEDANSGEQLLTTPVSNGTPVVLSYNHSVEKTPVHDIYVVDNDSLVMTGMEFQSYGWGLPARANVTRENGSFTFDPQGRYEELYVKPGRTADHRLRVGNNSYDLVARSDAEGVRLHLTERSVLQNTLDTLDS
ncbi:hypothetical protein C448_08254 [Halococcus morrhuae DSM 1307]|uniref:DUF1850 domain-containing protein n=1 Tax=Halococcus morrhuae DSM 1307 TaxID=931277 RepID=M0MJD0_HALMO|nr:DUF1850 domain-containing protein [Halococcus morrhuae]EMA44525.1 hypothetical protein C448_08254 [Halococcus morrhuae DSM 1307]